MVQEVVGGRYALIAHLGGGAVSDVSLATVDGESDASKVVVVKRLKFGADAEPKAVAQFTADANLAMRLNHPNIAQALETDADDNGPYLVLEYLEGVSLARLRSRAQRRGDGIPRAILLHIVTEVATGLAYAHALEDAAGKSLKVVHRDLSPENIIVTYEGSTKLIDFGFALASTPAAARAEGMKGNLAYVAPEQARAGVALDARADVFALGVILWELLAGKRMYEGMSEADVLSRLADATPFHAVRTIAPDVPAALDAICAQALAKIRDDRFDSAFELREAIDKVSTAPELRTTPGEVAAFVSSLFADEREKMRAIVAEAIAAPVAPSASSASQPRVSVAPPPAANAFADMDSDPRIPISRVPTVAPPTPVPSAPELPEAPNEAPAVDAAPSSRALPAAAPSAPASSPALVADAVAAAPRVDIVRIEVEPSRDRRFAYAMGAAVAVAFAAVAVVAMTHKDDPTSDEGVAARRRLPTSEPAATTADPVVSANVEPEEVTVEIRVMPPAAHIFVDGVKAPNNPHRMKVVAGKFPHEIRAEAEGFVPYSTTIPFDRTRTLDVALPAKPRFGGPAPAPKPTPKDTNPY